RAHAHCGKGLVYEPTEKQRIARKACFIGAILHSCSSRHSSEVHLHGGGFWPLSQVYVDERKSAHSIHEKAQKAKERRERRRSFLFDGKKIQTRCCSDWIRPRI